MFVGGVPVRIVIVALILWIFIVPSAVAIYLAIAFVAKFAPNLYWVLAGLASALALSAILWASRWIANPTGKPSALSSTDRLQAASIPEQRHAKYCETDRTQTGSGEHAATAGIDLDPLQRKAKAASSSRS